ncbi:MAG: phosphatidate cytidylyltransferase [Acidimicrobiia bacterium]|nr:phosphatidate cytidylyltransferase [Acidimicrobiia bacterium]MBP8182223.1 phosphatidate cytidylyltransferase [Acidimicrobiia bacterium]
MPNSRDDDFGAVDDDGEPADWDLSFRIAPTRDPYSPPGEDGEYQRWGTQEDPDPQFRDEESTRAFDSYRGDDADASAWYEDDDVDSDESGSYSGGLGRPGADQRTASDLYANDDSDGDEGLHDYRSGRFDTERGGTAEYDELGRRTADTWGEPPRHGDGDFETHGRSGSPSGYDGAFDDADDDFPAGRYAVGDAEAARSHGRAHSNYDEHRDDGGSQRDARVPSRQGSDRGERSGWSEAPREPKRRPAEADKGSAKKRGTPAQAKPAAKKPSGGGRDLGMAALVGAALLVLGLLAMELGAAATTVLIMVIVGLGSAEFFAVLRERGYRPATLLGIAGSVGVVLAAYHHGPRAVAMLTVLMVFFSFAWFLFKVEEAPPLTNVAFTMLGFLMVGVFGSYGTMLVVLPDGIGRLAGAVACIVAADVGGYFVGRAIGRIKLAPDVSPGKTLEGFLGGVAASVLVAVLLLGMIAPWDADIMDRLLLGLVLGCIGPLGDLSASMVKRELGVKDFGALLPEHGGVLDRFDAMLFALPVTYYLSVVFILN